MREFYQHVFFGGPQRKLMGRGIPVYVYHYLGVPAAGTPDPYLYVDGRAFRKQCAAMKSHGYGTACLTEVAAACRDGNMPAKKLALTVDDGSRDFFEIGMEILAEHGFRAIQFLVAGQIGGINEWDAKHGHPAIRLMDEAQIREWLAAGHEIGSHTVTHRNLSKLDEPEARRQIIDSKKMLEDQFGSQIRHFCYPHGKSNDMVEELVREAGYETACTMRFGVNGPGGDAMALRRISPLSWGGLLGKALHRLGNRVRNTNVIRNRQ